MSPFILPFTLSFLASGVSVFRQTSLNERNPIYLNLLFCGLFGFSSVYLGWYSTFKILRFLSRVPFVGYFPNKFASYLQQNLWESVNFEGCPSTLTPQGVQEVKIPLMGEVYTNEVELDLQDYPEEERTEVLQNLFGGRVRAVEGTVIPIPDAPFQGDGEHQIVPLISGPTHNIPQNIADIQARLNAFYVNGKFTLRQTYTGPNLAVDLNRLPTDVLESLNAKTLLAVCIKKIINGTFDIITPRWAAGIDKLTPIFSEEDVTSWVKPSPQELFNLLWNVDTDSVESSIGLYTVVGEAFALCL